MVKNNENSKVNVEYDAKKVHKNTSNTMVKEIHPHLPRFLL